MEIRTKAAYALFGLVLSQVLAPLNAQNHVSVTSSIKQSLRNLACSNEDVVYTCETNGTFLTWIVDPFVPARNATVFRSNSPVGTNAITPRQAIRILTDTQPTLRSTLILRLVELENVTSIRLNVVCRTNNLLNDSKPYILSVPPPPPTKLTNNAIEGLGIKGEFLTFGVSWEAPSQAELDISHYFVRLYRESDNLVNVTKVERVTSAEFTLKTTDIKVIRVNVTTVNKCNQESFAASNEITVGSLTVRENHLRGGVEAAVVLVFLFFLLLITCLFGTSFYLLYHRQKHKYSRVDTVHKRFDPPPQHDGDASSKPKDGAKVSLVTAEITEACTDGNVTIKLTYNESAIQKDAEKIISESKN